MEPKEDGEGDECDERDAERNGSEVSFRSVSSKASKRKPKIELSEKEKEERAEAARLLKNAKQNEKRKKEREAKASGMLSSEEIQKKEVERLAKNAKQNEQRRMKRELQLIDKGTNRVDKSVASVEEDMPRSRSNTPMRNTEGSLTGRPDLMRSRSNTPMSTGGMSSSSMARNNRMQANWTEEQKLEHKENKRLERNRKQNEKRAMERETKRAGVNLIRHVITQPDKSRQVVIGSENDSMNEHSRSDSTDRMKLLMDKLSNRTIGTAQLDPLSLEESSASESEGIFSTSSRAIMVTKATIPSVIPTDDCRQDISDDVDTSMPVKRVGRNESTSRHDLMRSRSNTPMSTGGMSSSSTARNNRMQANWTEEQKLEHKENKRLEKNRKQNEKRAMERETKRAGVNLIRHVITQSDKSRQVVIGSENDSMNDHSRSDSTERRKLLMDKLSNRTIGTAQLDPLSLEESSASESEGIFSTSSRVIKVKKATIPSVIPTDDCRQDISDDVDTSMPVKRVGRNESTSRHDLMRSRSNTPMSTGGMSSSSTATKGNRMQAHWTEEQKAEHIENKRLERNRKQNEKRAKERQARKEGVNLPRLDISQRKTSETNVDSSVTVPTAHVAGTSRGDVGRFDLMFPNNPRLAYALNMIPQSVMMSQLGRTGTFLDSSLPRSGTGMNAEINGSFVQSKSSSRKDKSRQVLIESEQDMTIEKSRLDPNEGMDQLMDEWSNCTNGIDQLNPLSLEENVEVEDDFRHVISDNAETVNDASTLTSQEKAMRMMKKISSTSKSKYHQIEELHVEESSGEESSGEDRHPSQTGFEMELENRSNVRDKSRKKRKSPIHALKDRGKRRKGSPDDRALLRSVDKNHDDNNGHIRHATISCGMDSHVSLNNRRGRRIDEDYLVWKKRRNRIVLQEDGLRAQHQSDLENENEMVPDANDAEVIQYSPTKEQRDALKARRAGQLSAGISSEYDGPSLTKHATKIYHPACCDFRILENAVPDQLDVGEIQICPYCKARTFAFNCCDSGNVRIHRPKNPPPYIYDLLTASTDVAKHFREELTSYNNAFAMGSLSYDRNLKDPGERFMKVNGMLHHFFAGTSVPPGRNPMYHQCFKYQVNEATRFRVLNPVTGDNVRPAILRNIQMVLEENNGLVKRYKNATEILTDMVKAKKKIKNVFLVLKSLSEVNYHGPHHPGTLEQAEKAVNSYLYSMEADGGPPKQGVYIMHRMFGGKLEILGYWNPLQDPIGYPLLFPYGNSGYKRKEYKLKEEYAANDDEENRNLEWKARLDPYPFEGLDDECDEDCIDYETARKKYKIFCRERGEEVSEDEEEVEWEDASDEDEEEGELQDGQDVVGNDEDAQDNGGDDVDGVQQCQDNEKNSGLSAINVCLSDDEEEGDIRQHADHFFLENSDSEAELDNEVVEKCIEEDRHEDHADIESEEERLRLRRERMRIEKKTTRRILKEEARIALHNDKLRRFKSALLSKVQEHELLLFFKQEEFYRVIVDLEFMRRTKRKRKEHLFQLAKDIFDYCEDEVNSKFPFDDDFKQLEYDLNSELSMIFFDPEYRSCEEKIQFFRREQLCPTIQDDNEAIEFDDVGTLVQHEVGESPEKTNKKSRKKNAPVQNKGQRKWVSRREHGLHQFQVRDSKFHPYLSTLLLGQLYIIDVALRYIRERNDTQRKHMISLRGTNEESFSFQKHARAASKKGFKLGYAFQIPGSRIGSTAWFRREFENAMATVDRTGKPDLFITMTGNPDWPEIKNNLLPNSTWQSNPFLVNDVFHLKMQQLLVDVVQKELFGPVVSFCYSIEFQKRGMPHMHLLVTLKKGHKLDTSGKIDQYIRATIPEDPAEDDPEFEMKKRYRDNVINMMVHTTCVGRNDAICQRRPACANNRIHTRCTKNFPIPFNECTSTTDGGKVEYFRPDDGETFVRTVKKQDHPVDNRYVVPYNPFLLNKYACHINVEAVTTVDVIKYIYKYIYKGFDKALAQFIEAFEIDDGGAGKAPNVAIHPSANGRTGMMMPRGLRGSEKQVADMNSRIAEELRRYNVEAKDGERLTAYDEAILVEVFRQMTASEAAWLLQAYKISGNSHEIETLSVHEEGKMPVFFRHHEEERVRLRIESGILKSQLMGWFELNKKDEEANKYTYPEIPLYYHWNKKNGKCEWLKYQKPRLKKIVRVRPVSPRFIECFAVRLLVMHQKGVKSFEDLRTVDGVVYAKPQDAARAMGLMNSQMEYDLCLGDAVRLHSPYHLRQLFATILIFGGVTEPEKLWKDYEKEFYDRRLARNPDKARAAALYHLDYILSEHGLNVERFKLPSIDFDIIGRREMNFMWDDGMMPARVDQGQEADRMEALLNEDQRKAFDVIIEAVEDMGFRKNCFFLQGSGGTGKTFVYRTLYNRLQSMNISVAMIATTGIAATLLINGTTAHRKFCLPLNADINSRSHLEGESVAAREIAKTTVFIIDEATMASKFTFNCIDLLLRDIMNSNKPFGGKIILLGGDWKQLLPVVPGTSSSEAVQHTLKCDDLWSDFEVLTLNKNMRAHKDPEYATLLENIGNGLVNGRECSTVRLDPKMIVQSEDEAVDFIYGDLSIEAEDLAKSCILTSLNTETSEINSKVIERLPGLMKVYKAIDTPRDGIGMQVPAEYFRNDMPSGMPPFALHLKIGAIVILLRNLNVSRGLCNGSRLEIIEMRDMFLVCKLLTTNFAGEVVWISRYLMEPAANGKKNSNYSRFQFPIRLAYAMTINKSQGQTFDRVAVILKNNVFAHGQLYVALSRVRESQNVRVFSAAYEEHDDKAIVVVINKVEQRVLEPVDRNSLRRADYSTPDAVFVKNFQPKIRQDGRRKRKFKHVHSHCDYMEIVEKRRKLNVRNKSKKKNILDE